FEGAADAVVPAVEQEVEIHGAGVTVLVDQFVVILLAGAEAAEEAEGDAVEDRRLAAAVGAGQQPEGGAVEGDDLLFLVAQEPLEGDAFGDHRGSSSRSCSASASTAGQSSWSASWVLR